MNTSISSAAPQFDVAILGTGIGGSLLGAILARHGAKVLMLDSGIHPRFAVGESTIPNTSLMLQLLSERYDVPEIMHIASPSNLLKHVGSTSGVKRNFGFVYQREGTAPDPMEAMQLGISELAREPESHWFRQDVDAYMMHVAIRYGATVRLRTNITQVGIDKELVTLEAGGRERFTARYVVDCGGYQSPLAKTFDLRENPTRMKHHSRCLFTHMIDVRPYDDCLKTRRLHGMSVPWFEGTLHHVFERGWIWVIPFNNHAASTNPLCSVGLTLDPRYYPKPDMPPEQEFRTFIQRFPTVAEQFRDARTVREWVSTDRLQYSSRQVMGHRYCLIAHAAGNVDALFSRGLINTTETINALAGRLLSALADNDFSVERFEYLERLEQNLFDCNDRLVNCAFISFSDFELWNAWFRVWALGVVSSEAKLMWPLIKYRYLKDPGALAAFNSPPYPGLLFAHAPGYKVVFDEAAAAVEAYEAGRITADDATRRVLSVVKQADYTSSLFMPLEKPFALPFMRAVKDPEMRNLNVRPRPFMRWVLKGLQLQAGA